MEIKPTTVVALIGPSGAGKMTLLEIFIRCFASNCVISVEDQGISHSNEDMQILPRVWAPIIDLRENNMTRILPHISLYT